MEDEPDDAECTRPPLMGDLVGRKTKQTFREKDQIDRLFLRKLLEDRGEWPVA